MPRICSSMCMPRRSCCLHHITLQSIQPQLCLQVDTETDDKALEAQLIALKANGVKNIISIGGWSFSTGTDVFAGTGSEQIFPEMASTNASRAAFIQSAISYAKQRGFDGIDIDWE